MLASMARVTAREIYRSAREAGFSPDQATTMTAIALAESGGETDAHNDVGEDSIGLFQINRDAHPWTLDWDLTDPLVNARAAFRVSQQGATIAPWTTTHGDQAPYMRFRTQAQAAATAEGESGHLGVWTGTSGYGADVAAGNAGPGSSVDATQTGNSDQALQTFLDAALDQTGDAYIFGTTVSMEDPNPRAFDCCELVRWAAARAGVAVPDGSWTQYLALKEQGGEISVDQALSTPGALLFSFSSPPSPGSGRPSQAHVAISLGDG